MSYDALTDAVERAHDGYSVSWLLVGAHPRAAVKVFLESGTHDATRFVDPVTAADLGPARFDPLLTWLARLHTDLLAGETGRIVNGIGAIALTLLSITGAVLWWPGQKNWRRSLGVKWRASWKRVNWDLHSAIGIWTLALTFVWSFTGVYLIFPEPFQRALSRFTPTEHPREAPSPPPLMDGRRFASLDTIVAAAERATPDAVTTWVSPPHGDEGARAVVIRHERYEPLASHSPIVYLDAYTARVQHIDVELTGNPGDTIQRWFGYLHFGNFGGAPVKVLWTITGLAPAVLAVTGSLMWWNRVLSKRLGRRATPRAQELRS
jgi:uncharacterized iron-regulated membrane protein